MYHKQINLFHSSININLNKTPLFEFFYDKKIVGVNQRMTFNFKSKRMILNPKYKKSLESLRKFIILNFKESKTARKLIVMISTQRNKQDIDSCIKPILDAMEGVVFYNDKQVEYLLVVKNDGEDGFIVRVWEL